MQIPVTLPGFELRSIEVQLGGLFSIPKIIIDNEPAPKGPKRGQFLLLRNDGTTAIAQLRNLNFLDPIPQLIIDGKPHAIVEPLKWYQWLWGGLPFALAIIGGALGGLFGAIALFFNGRIFRSNMNNTLKYLASAGVSLAAVVGFFLSAVIFQLSIASLFSKPELFSSDAGRFSIVTPTKFTEQTQTTEVPNIGSIDIHTFSGQQGDIAYYVTYTDYPVEIVQKSDPNKMLEGSRDGASSSVNGVITADSSISIDTYPGREFIVEATDESGKSYAIKSHVFLVDNRLYQIMVITPKGKPLSKGSDEFLLSFKLLGN